jgi:uncharacterized protein involved in cysteine biosynthesis
MPPSLDLLPALSSASSSPNSSPPATAQTTTTGGLRGFMAGFRAAFAGLFVVSGDSRLFLLSLLPMLVQLGLLVGALAAVVVFAVPAGEAWVLSWLGLLSSQEGSTSEWAQALFTVVKVAVKLGVFSVGVVAAYVTALLASSAVCDPFFDVLSERTEELYLGKTVSPPFSLRLVVVGIGREAGASLWRLALWMAVGLPLWLLSFTFLGVVTGPLSLLWTWWMTSYEFLSRSLVRHSVDSRSRFKALFAHPALFIGFGAGAALLSIVPLTSPFLVVGATRLYLALAARGAVPSALSAEERAWLQATR